MKKKITFPFYGEGNSVKCIKENDKFYIVERYNHKKNKSNPLLREVLDKNVVNDKYIDNLITETINDITSLSSGHPFVKSVKLASTLNIDYTTVKKKGILSLMIVMLGFGGAILIPSFPTLIIGSIFAILGSYKGGEAWTTLENKNNLDAYNEILRLKQEKEGGKQAGVVNEKKTGSYEKGTHNQTHERIFKRVLRRH